MVDNEFLPNISRMNGSNIEKMKEQNQKLKSQLRELAQAMDDVIQKEKERRANKYKKAEPDENTKEKLDELKSQQKEILQTKNKINSLKRQLENTYDINRIVAKEDELKHLKKELAGLVDEKDSLMKIKNEQVKALDYLRNEEEYSVKLKNLQEQLRKVKDENKSLSEQLQENEKNLRLAHEKLIKKEEKIKEIQTKIKDKKQNQGKGEEEPEITEELIKNLEEKLQELEKEKSALEKKFNEKMRNLEREKRELTIEAEKKLLILKEKEKEYKLNQLKLKEISKLIRHNAVQPLKTTDHTNPNEEKDHSINKPSNSFDKEEKLIKNNSFKPKQVKSIPSKKESKEDKKPEEKKELINNEIVNNEFDIDDLDKEIKNEIPAKKESHNEFIEDYNDDFEKEKTPEISDKPEKDTSKSQIEEQKANVFAKPNFFKKKK